MQWFRVGDVRARELTLMAVRELHVRDIMIAFSWADLHNASVPGSWGESSMQWLDETIFLLRREGAVVYPRLFYTPPELCRKRAEGIGMPPQTNFPPDCLEDWTLFCRAMLERYAAATGDYWQLGNELNNDAYWSAKIDPSGEIAAAMLKPSIDLLHDFGKKVVLGGIIPPYIDWLWRMGRKGVLDGVDALGVHAFPGTWDKVQWAGWDAAIERVKPFLPRGVELWITETGFSTEAPTQRERSKRERMQIEYFEHVCRAPADRVFWYSAVNQAPDHPTDNQLNQGKRPDPRAYHFGIVMCSGTKKPLYHYWQETADRLGLDQLRVRIPIRPLAA